MIPFRKRHDGAEEPGSVWAGAADADGSGIPISGGAVDLVDFKRSSHDGRS